LDTVSVDVEIESVVVVRQVIATCTPPVCANVARKIDLETELDAPDSEAAQTSGWPETGDALVAVPDEN